MRITRERLIILAAVVIPSALLLVAGSIELINSRAILPAFRFILPNAKAYLATGPLQNLWGNGPSHISRVFSQAASTNGNDLAKQIKDFLTDHCITMEEQSNLAQLGIDETRGAALTVVDSARQLIAIPVANPERFASFLTRAIPQHHLKLSADDGSQDNDSQDDDSQAKTPQQAIKAIRIDANISSGVVICQGAGKPITLTESMLFPLNRVRSIHFQIGLRAGETARIGIHCSSILADGTTGSCRCKIDADDCSAQTRSLQPTLNDMVHSHIAALSQNLALSLTEDTALIASAPDQELPTFIEAGRRTQDNLGYFLSDDSFLQTFSHLNKIAERDDGLIFGAVTVPVLPITGRTHFALDIGPQRLTARILVPWQTLQTTLLESLATPTRFRSEQDNKLISADAELQINDPRLGYYLGFVSDYGFYSRFHRERIGTFVGFFRDIENMKRVGSFKLAARGIHDGVPDLVMSLEMSRDEAEDLLLNQRARMRKARDREILWAAAQKYIDDNNSKPPTAIDQLRPYLNDESGAMWDHYQISPDATWGDPASMQKAFDVSTQLNNDDFLVGYQALRDNIQIQYVAPAITANDLAYRLTSGSEKVDTAALQAGRFRLAAYVDQQNSRLLVGTDADALAEVLKSPYLPNNPNNPPTREPSKFTFLGDPKYLINQGLLDPDKEINRIVRDYLRDFEQYRRLNARVEPLPTRQGISATIVLSHE